MPSEARHPSHALVTGTSAGIGQAIAQRLLDAGWRVTGWDRAPASIDHPRFSAQAVDLGDTAALEQALAGLTGSDAAPDAFVHAAGWMRTAPLDTLALADGEAMWRLHVQAATQITQALVPAMRARQRGRVVFIGSRVAQGMAGRSQYAAVKAALIASARSWAAELAPAGVTVNVVSPAATRTAMLADPGRAASAPQLPPIGRYIEPAEVAALVAFLLSDEAAAITGQDLAICGGASLPR